MNNRHHYVDARRALLEIFLQRMRLQNGEYDERLRAIYSSDVLKVVEEGICAAFEGKCDPFRLSTRGLKPKLSRQEGIDAVMQVMSRPKDETLESAFERVGGTLSTSSSVIRDAYYDPDVRTFAELQRDAYRKNR
ncbi:hypothetical protein ACKVEX_12495 [Rhodocyclaceae bacterium SMB388]